MDFSGSHDPSGAADNSSLDQEDFYQEAPQVLIPSIYALVCCVGLVGNAMVIYVILKYAKMKTATNIYILNLAIADELFLLSVPFLAASAAIRRWPFGSLMCRLVLSVDAINMFTSVFCLTVLSVDCYVAVVHPAKAARYRRPAVAKAVNVCVWGASLLVILPVVVFADTMPASDGGVDCNFLWPEAVWSEVFVVYTFLLGFLLPVGAICLCYCLMAARTRTAAPGADGPRRSEKKTTRVVLLVVAVFVLCWMPFYTAQLLSVFHRPLDPTLIQLVVILSYANSGANPVLYGFALDNFRRSFRRLVCFRWLEAGLEAEQVEYCEVGAGKQAARSPLDLPGGRLTSEAASPNGTYPAPTSTV